MGEAIVGLVGLAIAAPPLIKPIKESISAAKKLISDYREADAKFSKTSLHLETHLLHAETLAEYVHDNFSDFNDKIKLLFHRLLRALEETLFDFQLAVVESGLDEGNENGRRRRAAYALKGHKVFKKFDEELRDWERRFNDVFFVVILNAGRRVPNETTTARPNQSKTGQSTVLSDLFAMINHTFHTNAIPPAGHSLRLSPEEVSTAGCVPIDYSSILYHAPTPSSPAYILEHHTRSSATETDIHGIASFLAASQPSLTSLLRCTGFSDHTFRYTIPPGYADAPISLRSALLYDNSRAKHPLEERLAIMKRLASAVLWVHVAGHVHKSIRSDNVILFGSADINHDGATDTDSRKASFPHTLGTPFLLGFDLSRPSAGLSSHAATIDLQKAYYLPPARQGSAPQARYTLRDDVYSLGVVFLELALWRSFASLQRDAESGQMRWCRGKMLVDGKGRKKSPEQVRDVFVGLARKEVAREMGSRVSEVVIACLEGWSSEGVDGEGREAEAYVKRVLGMLDAVVL